MIEILRKLHFTIGRRIFAGFGLALLLFAAQAIVSYLGLDRVVHNFSQYGETNQGVRRILEIERDVVDLQRVVLAYTYSGYAGVAERVREQVEQLSNRIDAARNAVVDPQRADILRRMDDHFQLYAANFDAAVEERTLRDRMAYNHMAPLGDEAVTLLEEIHSGALPDVDPSIASRAGSAQGILLLAQRDALRFLIEPNSRLVRKTKARLSHLSSSLDALLAELEPGEVRNIIIRVRDLTPRFEESFYRMVQATRAYMHLVYVVMGGEAAEIAFLANELKEITLREQAGVESAMAASVSQTQRTTGAVSFLAVSLGLLLAWWISRNIADAVRSMTRALTDLARGRMDTVIPGEGRGDEIGAMAMAANVFKEKAHELANASRYKSEFLANMSHELRTPLNSLLILSRLLARNEEGNLSVDQVESARVIHESGSDLLRLINDILDLSKVEAGRMDLYLETRPFPELTAAMARLFSPVAEARGLAFTTRIDAELPPGLRTDWGKVEQILRNFLSNALKFTESGAVSVVIGQPSRGEVFMNHDLNPANCIALTVTDTGIGIPADIREQIFEAFRQADGATNRKYGGTGLGLSISRRFAEMLGGEIQVESREGEGSAFTLFLPVKFPVALEPAQNHPVAGALASDSDSDKGAKAREPFALNGNGFRDPSRVLLLVDDDPRNLFALKRVLQGRVGRVLTAENGRQALEVLEERPDVDLVLMDIMMPEMDGYEAMQAIRSQTRFSRLPILALTAKAMPGDRERCIEAGASDYLAKPVDPIALLRALSDWLKTPKEGAPPRMAGTPADPAASPPLLREGDQEPVEASVEAIVLGDPPITVLIVDDDMRNTFSLALALQKKADRVLLARDGIKAMEELEKAPDVSIVLLDIMMPNMNGYEVMREIRKREDLKGLPVIALTAKAQPEDRDLCLEAGANDYLAKPVELAALLEKMRTLLAHPGGAEGFSTDSRRLN